MIKFYQRFILNGDNVLDIGCADGKLAVELRNQLRRKFELTGVDVLPNNPPYKFKLIKDNNLQFRDKEFDVAMFNDVLHHMPHKNQEKMIDEALRVANTVLIYEAPRSPVIKIIDILLNKINDKRIALPLAMRNIEEWISLFKRKNLAFESKVIGMDLTSPFLNYCFMIKKQLGTTCQKSFMDF